MKKANLKKAVAILVICSLITIVGMPQKGEAQNDLERIEAEIANLQSKLNQMQVDAQQTAKRLESLQFEKHRTQEEINALNAEIAENREKQAELNKKIDETVMKLEEATWAVEEARQRIEERDKLLSSRLHLMYTNGAVSYLDVLMNATSFMDFLERFNLLKSLVGQDRDILESNKRDKALKEAKEEEINQYLAQLQDDFLEREKLIAADMAARHEKTVAVASMETEEEHLEAVTEEEQAAMLAYAQEIRKKQNEKKQIETYYLGGELGYPLPNKYPITSRFGYRTDPITGAHGAFHGGIDFGAPGGTEVKAAEKGRVILAEPYSGYGYSVMIDHGGGLMTFYAHMRKGSITVKRDEIVEKGQTVGLVGTTGRSTGNHLHFEVFKNDQKVDPADYLNLD